MKNIADIGSATHPGTFLSIRRMRLPMGICFLDALHPVPRRFLMPVVRLFKSFGHGGSARDAPNRLSIRTEFHVPKIIQAVDGINHAFRTSVSK